MGTVFFNILCNHPGTGTTEAEENYRVLQKIAHLLRPPVSFVLNEMELYQTSAMYARLDRVRFCAEAGTRTTESKTFLSGARASERAFAFSPTDARFYMMTESPIRSGPVLDNLDMARIVRTARRTAAAAPSSKRFT